MYSVVPRLFHRPLSFFAFYYYLPFSFMYCISLSASLYFPGVGDAVELQGSLGECLHGCANRLLQANSVLRSALYSASRQGLHQRSLQR